MKIQTQREIYESITKYQYLSVTNLYQFGKFINEETKSTWKIPIINPRIACILSNKYMSNPKIPEKNQMYVKFLFRFTLHTVMHVYMQRPKKDHNTKKQGTKLIAWSFH